MTDEEKDFEEWIREGDPNRPTTLEGLYEESINWLKGDSELPDLWTDIENYVAHLKSEAERREREAFNEGALRASRSGEGAEVMSKTKPDGYTRPDWIEGLRSGWNGLNMYAAPPNHLFEPVCLVPPELLATTQEVGQAIERRIEQKQPVSDAELRLLEQLNRIWPRGDK